MNPQLVLFYRDKRSTLCSEPFFVRSLPEFKRHISNAIAQGSFPAYCVRDVDVYSSGMISYDEHGFPVFELLPAPEFVFSVSDADIQQDADSLRLLLQNLGGDVSRETVSV